MPFCTLTGADETTDLGALANLSKQYPFVEWGFLYSPKQQGLPGRYPSTAWLQRALETLPAHVRVAVHFCGRGVPNLLAGEEMETRLASLVEKRGGRIQLNFNVTHRKVALPTMKSFLANHPNLSVITQYNDANMVVWRPLLDHPNHSVLFDFSGGRGISPQGWLAPLHGVLCGYAGGLGPDNLAKELPHIAAAAAGALFWIDMEGKLRIIHPSYGFDMLSLELAITSLEIIQKFCDQYGHVDQNDVSTR